MSTKKDKEAKLIANCFNAIANTLTVENGGAATPAHEVMKKIKLVTDGTVRLFAKSTDSVKYVKADEGTEERKDINDIEGELKHGILRDYLKKTELNKDKIVKSKFYKDVQKAIGAADGSLKAEDAAGNLLAATNAAVEAIKHKSSNAAEFLATLFQIVEEYQDERARETLSVVVGIILNLLAQTPTVIAKGRKKHETVLNDQKVRNAATELENKWKKYGETPQLITVDLTEELEEEKTLQDKVNKTEKRLERMEKRQEENLFNNDYHKNAKKIGDIGKNAVLETEGKNRNAMTQNELAEVLKEPAFEKALKDLTGAIDAWGSSTNAADKFAALMEAKNQKVGTMPLIHILTSIHHLSKQEKARYEILELANAKILKRESLKTLLEKLETLAKNKKDYARLETDYHMERIALVVTCQRLNTAPKEIETTYSDKSTYENELRTKVIEQEIAGLKWNNNTLETGKITFGTLLKSVPNLQIDVQETQRYIRGHKEKLNEESELTEDEKENLENLVGQDLNEKLAKHKSDCTLTTSGKALKKEDWDWSHQMDNAAETKDYATSSEKIKTISGETANKIPGLHTAVGKDGIKHDTGKITELENQYKDQSITYLGTKNFATDLGKGYLVQDLTIAEEKLAKFLTGLETTNFEKKEVEGMWTESDENGVEEDMKEKVLTVKPIIDTLKDLGLTKEVLQNIEQLREESGEMKLLVKKTEAEEKKEEPVQKPKENENNEEDKGSINL